MITSDRDAYYNICGFIGNTLLLDLEFCLLSEFRQPLVVVTHFETVETELDWSYYVEEGIPRACAKVFEIATVGRLKGDILLLIRNDEDIHLAYQIMEEMRDFWAENLLVYAISDWSTTQLAPATGRQKVFLCTSTPSAGSHTIEGIAHVIDLGLHEMKVFLPEVSAIKYETRMITRSMKQQRTLFCHRSITGVYHQLYPNTLVGDPFPSEKLPPWIWRSNSRSLCLELKRLGADQLDTLRLIEPPGWMNMIRAVDELQGISFLLPVGGALAPDGAIAAEFPIDPLLTHLLFHSARFHCSNEILSLVALLSVGDVFLRPEGKYDEADKAKKKFIHVLGDHLTLLKTYEAFKRCMSVDNVANL